LSSIDLLVFLATLHEVEGTPSIHSDSHPKSNTIRSHLRGRPIVTTMRTLQDTQQEFEQMLGTQPSHQTILSLLIWVRALLSILYNIVLSLYTELNKDQSALAKCSDRIDHLKQKNQQQQQQLPSLTSTLPAQPTLTCRKKCRRCHTFGHDQDSCCNKDPEVMKKQVAKNKRLKKAHKESCCPFSTISLPSLCHFTLRSYCYTACSKWLSCTLCRCH
jgi:hypothetical protein